MQPMVNAAFKEAQRYAGLCGSRLEYHLASVDGAELEVQYHYEDGEIKVALVAIGNSWVPADEFLRDTVLDCIRSDVGMMLDALVD